VVNVGKQALRTPKRSSVGAVEAVENHGQAVRDSGRRLAVSAKESLEHPIAKGRPHKMDDRNLRAV
jgi:hypothetical protein